VTENCESLQQPRKAPSLLSLHLREYAGEIENPERAGRGRMQPPASFTIRGSQAEMMINALRALRFFAVDFLGMNLMSGHIL
jgi:hypothetical protein